MKGIGHRQRAEREEGRTRERVFCKKRKKNETKTKLKEIRIKEGFLQQSITEKLAGASGKQSVCGWMETK